MKAVIIGKNETQFTDRENKPQHYVKYHLAVNTGDIDEGQEALTSSWNVLESGVPPDYKVNDKVVCKYGKNSKIIIESLA